MLTRRYIGKIVLSNVVILRFHCTLTVNRSVINGVYGIFMLKFWYLVCHLFRLQLILDIKYTMSLLVLGILGKSWSVWIFSLLENNDSIGHTTRKKDGGQSEQSDKKYNSTSSFRILIELVTEKYYPKCFINPSNSLRSFLFPCRCLSCIDADNLPSRASGRPLIHS